MSVSDGLFIMLFVSALGSIIAARWKFAKANPSLTSRQEMSTFIGLLANSAVLVFPFFYAFSLPLQQAVRWEYVLFGSWGFSALTIVVSFFGIKRARFPLILGAVSIAIVLTMIPIGIL